MILGDTVSGRHYRVINHYEIIDTYRCWYQMLRYYEVDIKNVHKNIGTLSSCRTITRTAAMGIQHAQKRRNEKKRDCESFF